LKVIDPTSPASAATTVAIYNPTSPASAGATTVAPYKGDAVSYAAPAVGLMAIVFGAAVLLA